MNSNIAKVALAFLERVQLQGSEVEAYQAVRQALTEAMNWEAPAPRLEAVDPLPELAEK